ncbi:MAG: TerB family tellurite resistance protein [Rhodobiaceae bacterium]|nr:TerB family tellurite resistance protein [Rhodobiaceae bacterium]MCC0055504.1 TerB family tellurite resistance protein [Rhodobiaceae bacterium]
MSFVNALRGFFAGMGGEGEARHDPPDARLAAAALAVHAIAVDGEVSESEKLTLRRVLKQSYKLDEKEAEALIRQARELDQEAVDLFAFTSRLKRALSIEERRDVVTMLWELVYADGTVHELEDNLVWRVAELLDIPTRDRVILRQRFLAGDEGDTGEGDDGADGD